MRGYAFSVLRSSDASRLIDHKNERSKCSINAFGPPIWPLKMAAEEFRLLGYECFQDSQVGPDSEEFGNCWCRKRNERKATRSVCVCVSCVSVKALCSYGFDTAFDTQCVYIPLCVSLHFVTGIHLIYVVWRLWLFYWSDCCVLFCFLDGEVVREILCKTCFDGNSTID